MTLSKCPLTDLWVDFSQHACVFGDHKSEETVFKCVLSHSHFARCAVISVEVLLHMVSATSEVQHLFPSVCRGEVLVQKIMVRFLKTS